MMEPLPKINSLEPFDDRKKLVRAVIAATCHEVGFSFIKEDVLDLLVSMYIAYLSELSQSTKQICEHSGRTEPIPGDVMMAMIELGQDITTLPAYTFRIHKIHIQSPSYHKEQPPLKILQTGAKKHTLPYIPDHFPPFPDPHSYIATPTMKQPISDYQTLREKSSTHKRNVERGLTNFMARTDQSNLTYSLFPNDKIFPLIGIKTDNVPYLSALLQKEQTWDDAEKTGMCQLNSLINKHRAEAEHPDKLNDPILIDIVKDVNTKEEDTDQAANNELEGVDSLFILPPNTSDNLLF